LELFYSGHAIIYQILGGLQVLFRFSSQPTIRKSLVKLFPTLGAAAALYSARPYVGFSFCFFFHAPIIP
jgi:hypothetical protein